MSGMPSDPLSTNQQAGMNTPVSMTNDAPEPVMTDSPDPMPNQMPEPMMESPQPEPMPTPPASTPTSPSTTSESLEDQNIFYLLGVENGTSEQKETFLDELQQVIWEDFLENDVQLLLTKDELSQLQQMTGDDMKKPLMEQEAVVVFLEKLIPDLEEIMLEKALELKADLMKERIAGMRELMSGKTEELAKISDAEQLLNEDKWLSAARLLNSIAE